MLSLMLFVVEHSWMIQASLSTVVFCSDIKELLTSKRPFVEQVKSSGTNTFLNNYVSIQTS